MSRWKSSFAISIVINIVIFLGGAVYINYYAKPDAEHKPEPIEMEIVSDSGGGTSAPQIVVPKPEKIEIPPTPTQEEVKQIMRSMGEEEARTNIDFQLQQKVRFKSGQFAEQIGTIAEINADKGKLKVLVEMFGRETPVEVDFTQVEEVE